jgi:hypothetical protein
MLVVGGLAAAAFGALLLLGTRLPWLRVGRLPGDVLIQRDGFSFYFPIVTMLLVSGLLTLVFWLIGRSRG